MAAAPVSHAGVRVASGNGVEVHTDSGSVALDPKRQTPDAVVTHGHLDHLVPGAYMTPATLDFLRVRKPARSGRSVRYHEPFEVGGVTCRLHDAGHVLGAAMVECSGVLYTGDFNPEAGLAAGAAKPVDCDILITESTYGEPGFDLPPKALVLESMESWALRRSFRGPVAFGAYQLGRAQEVIALMNRAGQVPVVSADIGALTAVYNAHGHDLQYAVMGSPRARDLEEGAPVYVVPRAWLKKGHDFTKRMRARNGACAYLSGWCHKYQYFRSYDIEAQFALSDHASFTELLDFVSACGPRRVYTTHGYTKPLARAVRDRLGIPAEPL